ncbi:DNA polymerase kappa [Andrographis paniculata]|uniref:DNA polymerase kappa n=1 Tax=Andrographis paniculata TaxID=175694 RepID=UPI0021E9891D|nr:DNA polymerase kappa [Andrographis paniculata]
MEEGESSKSNSGNDSARPWESYNTVYTTAKAGMEGVDKEKVQRVVYEMSKGSKYFENEERKEAYMKRKIESMREQLAKLTPYDISNYQKVANRRIAELEATRDLSRTWLHVDMDAFYAAVETLCNPSLKGKPMAVGGMSMISTANYEARKFGVRAAMPGFIGRKLCPQLIFVPPDFTKYTHYSDLTRKVFQKYDANFLAGSLDEAYLDITNFCHVNGMTGGEVAEELRESVHTETGLTCSAGVAPNRLLAKICSDINKPNGQFVLPNERTAIMTFISSLPIRKIGGIGKVTENILKGAFGITTCEEMLQKSGSIYALFSHSSAEFFLSVALGLGRTDTPEKSQRKSMSNERTFSPTEDETVLFQKLVELSENLSSDLKKEDLCGRTLTLKLKTSCFEVRSRAVTLPNYISSSDDILKHAKKLLKAELPVSLRLMGLRMSQFNDGRGAIHDPKQKTLANFIVSEDPPKVLGDQALSVSHSNNDSLNNDRVTSCFSDAQWPCEPDILNTSFNLISATNGDIDTELKGSSGIHVDRFHDNVDQSVERDPSSELAEQSKQGHDQNATSCIDDGPGSSSSPKEPIIEWLNGYQCSACGIELPPSFVEERQEHLDFHLAERLQDEERCNVNRNVKSRQRSIRKDQISHGHQKKKQKLSPSAGKHIPIDTFFTKTSQNF